MSQNDNTAHAIASGIGLAIGLVARFALHLAGMWISLWVLAQFNWLPF